jgi:hypothetical protein
MTTPNENRQGDSALHICINCGEEVRHDGFAEGRAMFIDATCTRTCETLGGGEDTPAHFVNPEQFVSALREIVKETDGRNSSHIGQDRAFCIAREALRLK